MKSVIMYIILFSANAILAAGIARNVQLRNGVRRIFNRSGVLSGRASGGSGAYRPETGNAMRMIERFRLLYIEKSNIKHYLPFMNIYTLLLLIALLFVAAYSRVFKLLDFLPSAFVISTIIAMAPLFALDLLSRYNSEAVRKTLSEYISVLSRWCSVKEDIMYAFEKSLTSNIGEPLKTFVTDMVIQVNTGMDSSEALDILQMKVDNSQFRDFIINIKLSMKNRGDIVKLLTNLENQFYRIDEEYNRRSISTYKDRMLLYFTMFGVLGLAYFFISSTPQINDFYLGSVSGKLLLTVFCGMYAFGFYLTAGIMRFKN